MAQRTNRGWVCAWIVVLGCGPSMPPGDASLDGGAIDGSQVDDGGWVDASPDAEAPDSGPPTLPLSSEAEHARLEGTATRWPADSTAGEIVILGTSGEGALELDFATETEGPIEVWARIRAPTASHNSVFVTLDDEDAADAAMVWDAPITPVLRWYRVARRGAGGTHTRAEDPFSVTLEAGHHTLRITAREPSLELDAIFIAPAGQTPPSRLPEPPARAMTHSLTDFGAVGDGTTDDTEAIERALDALEPGDMLHIPAGRFRFTRSLVVRTGDVTIAGVGPESQLFADLPSEGTGAALAFLGTRATEPVVQLAEDAAFLDREVRLPADAPFEVGDLIQIESDDWGPIAPANRNDPGGLFFRDRVNFAWVKAVREEDGQRILTLDRPLFSPFAASRSRVLPYTPIAGVVVRDLRIDAPDRGSSTSNGNRNILTCSRCRDSFFADLELRHAFFSALGVGSSFATHVIRVHARDSVDTTTPGAGYGVTIGYSQAVVVRDSLFTGVMRHGVPVGAGDRECLILRTRHVRETHPGNYASIDIHGRDNYSNLIEENEMIGGSQGIIVGGGGSSWGNDGPWNVLRNNTIVDAERWGISVHKETYDTVIDGNSIRGVETPIFVETGSDATYVQGNRVEGFEARGVDVSESDRAYVRDNVFVPGAGAAHSVRVVDGTGYEVVDNDLGGGGLSHPGSGTVTGNTP